MLRTLTTLACALTLSACAAFRGDETISAEESYRAFADVKDQMVDYQSRMNWLARNPGQDPDLRPFLDANPQCGVPGGVRVDIVSAVATMTVENSTSYGVNASADEVNVTILGPTANTQEIRTAASAVTFPVSISSLSAEKSVADPNISPLAYALLGLRANIMRSQYTSDAPGCLLFIDDPTKNTVQLKLDRRATDTNGFYFNIGVVKYAPTRTEISAFTRTLTVVYRVSNTRDRTGERLSQASSAPSPTPGPGNVQWSIGPDPTPSPGTVHMGNGIDYNLE